MQEAITIRTNKREELIDITEQVATLVEKSDVQVGIVNVYAEGATCAIMIQENWDASVRMDVVNFLKKIIPKGEWIHDRQDGNGDAHLKSGLVGPSESIPIISGKIGLSQWQNIFFCEFDGPRKKREIICTIISQ